jgi:FtsP/CotA-like multicopper oxidase with cupredoxin domain
LPTIERDERIGARHPGAPGALSLTLEMERAPLRIGNHNVSDVPFNEPSLGRGASAYLFDPDGKQCRIRPADFHAEAFRKRWGYGGFRLELQQRDRLSIAQSSALDYRTPGSDGAPSRPDPAAFFGSPCQMTNSHTHGLLVSPYNTPTRLGDNVLPLAGKMGESDQCDPLSKHDVAHGDVRPKLQYEIQIPSKPAPDQHDALEDGKHPSGLFWLHPHVHGYSASQLTGGTTGLITVGSIEDYVRGPGTYGATPPLNMRFLMLKDAQIGKNADGGEIFIASPKPDLCEKTPADGKSFWPGGECKSADGSAVWAFTINGVQNPRIEGDLKPGEWELWRMANASPTVSYHLSIVPLNEAQASGPADMPLHRRNFHVLAKDGAGVKEAGAIEKEVLLMPGARFEILIPPLPADQEFALVSEGLETGGDAWPRVILATIRGKGGGGESKAAGAETAAAPYASSGPDINALTQSTAGSAPSQTEAAGQPLNGARPCDRLVGQERLILFVKNPAYTESASKWNRGDLLGLIAAVRTAGETDAGLAHYFQRADRSTPLDAMETIPFDKVRVLSGKSYENGAKDNFVPAFSGNPVLADVCANFDPNKAHYEDWVLENWTNEIHNFHVHQTRFTVAPMDKGDRRYFDFPCRRAAYVADPARKDDYNRDRPCLLDVEGAAPQVNFGDELIAQFYKGHLSTGYDAPGARDAAHDSVPLPRGTTACDGHVWTKQEIEDAAKTGNVCRPGRVTVRVRFNRREQIGTFPYHCHILEHEDRGMMGLIEVRSRR